MTHEVEWMRESDGELKRFQNPYPWFDSGIILRAKVSGVYVDVLCGDDVVSRILDPSVMDRLDDLARRAATRTKNTGEIRLIADFDLPA